MTHFYMSKKVLIIDINRIYRLKYSEISSNDQNENICSIKM